MAAAGDKRRVLVTGGGRGLGAAIVRALAAAGHDVTFTYRSADAEAAAMLRELADARPGQAFAAHSLDLADKAALDAFAKSLEAEAPYSAFVHNAGQSYDTLAMMLDQGKAETAMQVNFWSFTRLVGVLVRPMIRARDGRIVAIGSLTALQANQGNSVYAACKAALLGYMRTLAIETARAGVTVNYIAPDSSTRRCSRPTRNIARRWKARSRRAASQPRTMSPRSCRSCYRPARPTSPAPCCRLTAAWGRR